MIINHHFIVLFLRSIQAVITQSTIASELNSNQHRRAPQEQPEFATQHQLRNSPNTQPNHNTCRPLSPLRRLSQVIFRIGSI